MLVRDIKRLALILGPLFGMLLIVFSLWDTETHTRLQSQVSSLLGTPSLSDYGQPPAKAPAPAPPSPDAAAPAAPSSSPDSHGSSNDKSDAKPAASDGGNDDNGESHHEIFSLSTADKKFFPIEFGNLTAFNPNIIPHLTLNDTFIVVAQKSQEPEDPAFTFFEIGCNASFIEGALRCIEEPVRLPVAATTGNKDNCVGDLALMGLNIGPHDARVLYGPQKPYIMFGSNSEHTCFSMWLQDFRELVEWGVDAVMDDDFQNATELQRPPPYGGLEKNWFIFWDQEGQAYIHHEATPRRVFAKLNRNGSVGKDLGPLAAQQDGGCIARYLPELPEEHESIHQTTNSLRITTCNRADVKCMPDNTNTFIMTIIQHKTYYNFHSEY